MPLSPLRRCGLSGRSCLLLLITLLGSPAVCRLEEAVNASDVIAMDLAYLSALNATLVVWRTPTQIQGQFFDPALPPGPLFTVHNPAQSLPELQVRVWCVSMRAVPYPPLRHHDHKREG